MQFCPTYHLAGASSLPVDVGYFFLVGSNILQSMVVQQRVVVLEFSQEKMSACPSALLSYATMKLSQSCHLTGRLWNEFSKMPTESLSKDWETCWSKRSKEISIKSPADQLEQRFQWSRMKKTTDLAKLVQKIYLKKQQQQAATTNLSEGGESDLLSFHIKSFYNNKRLLLTKNNKACKEIKTCGSSKKKTPKLIDTFLRKHTY